MNQKKYFQLLVWAIFILWMTGPEAIAGGFSKKAPLPNTPLVVSAEKLKEGYGSLKSAMEEKKLGYIETSTASEIEKYQKDADDYLKWKQRKTPASFKQKLESACQRNKSSHTFCPVFLDDNYFLYNPPKRVKTNTRLLRKNAQKAYQHMKKKEYQKLSTFTESEIRNALKNYKSEQGLSAFVSDLKNNNSCPLSVVSFLLAGKLEEYFPKNDVKENALLFYKKVIDCGESEFYSRALFRYGLIQLWNKNYKNALTAFEDLVNKSGDKEYLSRAIFWVSYCAKVLGLKDKVKAAQIKILQEAPLSIHTLLAFGDFPEAFQGYYFMQDSEILYRSKINEKINNDILMTELMIERKELHIARRMLQSRFEEFDKTEPEFRLYLAYLFHRADFYIEKFRLVAPLFKEKPELISRASLEIFFPYKKFNSKHFDGLLVNEYLALALIRQESAFNPRAHSAMNARGLMQVLPSTARTVDRKVKPPQLFNEDINVRIGSRYFDRLIRRFDGDVESALMGYNAGALRVGEWNDRYPVDDPVLFLDLVPFKETREYVSSIARNYFWYAVLYRDAEVKKSEDFKLPDGIRNKFKILRNSK